jgi:cyclic-di-GMP phosphodiesterase TipF (flagellum assembly factor)
MTQQIAMPDSSPPNTPRYGDAFVVFSVTVLSCAIGAWLLQRLGLALWAGMVAALAVYAVLLSLHLLMRRSLNPGAEHPATVTLNNRRAAAPPSRAPAPPLPAQAPFAPAADAIPPSQSPPRPELAAKDAAKGTMPPPPPLGQDARERAAPPAARPTKPNDEPPASRPAPFSFRPSREPPFPPAARAPLPPAAPLPPPPTLPEPAAQPEMSVEVVQDLIKKLADELNTATGGERSSPAPERTEDTEAMIGRSVAALQTAARTMHHTGGGSPGEAAAWWPEPDHSIDPGPTLGMPPRARGHERAMPPVGAPPQPNPQLARIAEAIAAERMEVMLEPIHALVEGRPRHFEVSMRLVTADGMALTQPELARATHGTGLMPRVDAARIVRAARVAGRLGQRGRQGAVLAAMAGESLADSAFIDAAAAGNASGNGMSLVLAFAQSEVRSFTHAHTRALAALAGAGYRFGLQAMTDLDMDFGALNKMGFSFVELDAPVFLEGLPCAGGRIPAADLCRYLADFGLSLIVGRIEDDWLLARILGFGVLYGKGTLFGGPRQVKDEVVSGPAAA